MFQYKKILSAIVLTIAAVPPALAADCAAMVKGFGPSAGAVLVTINNRNVASYHATALVHRDAFKTLAGIVPSGLVTPKGNGIDNPGVGPQLFSDRYAAGNQPFNVNKPDSITLAITDKAPVTVTVTLNSWGNAKVRFTPTCEAGGFMHGVTPDVNYLLRLSK